MPSANFATTVHVYMFICACNNTKNIHNFILCIRITVLCKNFITSNDVPLLFEPELGTFHSLNIVLFLKETYFYY